MDAAVHLEDVSVFRHVGGVRKYLLSSVDWTVQRGERWAVLGPNGAGKTTLLKILSARMHPSTGTAALLGKRLGRTPIPRLRTHIAVVERTLAQQFFPTLTARDVVLTGITGTTSLLPEHVDDAACASADQLLDEVGLAGFHDRSFRSLSDGERARTMLARALVGAPELVVLDEAVAGLDLPGRELFLGALESLASLYPETSLVLTAHHLEDLPESTSHALLLRGGTVLATGPVATTLADEQLTACFGLPVHVTRNDRRWSAVAVPK